MVVKVRRHTQLGRSAMVAATKELTHGEFVVDRNQRNIVLSNIRLTISANGGVIYWSIDFDQYNRTHATGTPNNATVYIDLLYNNGALVPGDQIKIAPRHDF